MKLRVVGWTSNDNTDIPAEKVGWAAGNAVIDDIKAYGYLFSGYDHQEGSACTPVLNDGKIRRFSQRGFGGIMAEAHGYTGRTDYSLFAFGVKRETLVLPAFDRYFDPDKFTPETDLNETFEVTVPEEVFVSAQTGEIKLDELPGLRYLDVGDTLILHCGGRAGEFSVGEVAREKDISREERLKLELDFYAFHDEARRKRAEEIFGKIKTILKIALKQLHG